MNIGQSNLTIGMDLDNTLLLYDELMVRIAREREWSLVGRSKREIRDALRAGEGEAAWRELQVAAYGRRCSEATVAPGALEFLRRCRREGVAVRIVSHKTPTVRSNNEEIDLRAAALACLSAKGLFADAELGITPKDIHFEASRQAKLERIGILGCTHFIDDLEETFAEDTFPESTERILFAPDRRRGPPGIRTFSSWMEISSYLFGQSGAPAAVAEAAAELLGRPVQRLDLVRGGRNSQVYACLAASERYVVKRYFSHPSDPRDRLGVEFSSLRFLNERGVTAVPRAIACDPRRGVGIYEHIPGPRATDTPIAAADIDEAVDFVRELKDLSPQARHSWVQLASEATFALGDTVSSIRSRLDRFSSFVPRSGAGIDLHRFLTDELRPALDTVTAWAASHLGEAGVGASTPDQHRILSPSDFGFHNAIRGMDGRLRFVDLEYFGWDDVAKTVSDFSLHPRMRLTDELKRRFVSGVTALFAEPTVLSRRIEALYPLYGLKWCAIFLNEFLPEHDLRRRFAGPVDVWEHRAIEQLNKARRQLEFTMGAYKRFPYGG